jgi:hypothetical protein
MCVKSDPIHFTLKVTVCVSILLSTQCAQSSDSNHLFSGTGFNPGTECATFHKQQLEVQSGPEANLIPNWQLIGELTDPDDFAINGNVDIQHAWIEQSGLLLRFSMQTRLPIRTDYPLPQDSGTFFWLVDADSNSVTGQPQGGIGSEFNVRVVVGEQFGGVFVDAVGQLPGGGSGVVTIIDDVIQVEVALNQLSSPAEFLWVVDNWEDINGVHYPGNGHSAIAIANILPAPPPAAKVELLPPLLMLSPAGPAQDQLVAKLWDTGGSELANEGHAISYFFTAPTMLAILSSQSGEVQALTPPTDFVDTPYALANGDGLQSSNASVIRITESDLGFDHLYYSGKNISFYLPPIVEGVNLDSITMMNDVVLATDYSYWAQQHGVGTTPFSGNTQYLVLDIGEDSTVPCGLSGNPIRLGWTLGPGEEQGLSCYIVSPSEDPRWFIIFHELGHNFTFESNSFGPFANGNGDYIEGIASIAALWAFWSIDSCPTALNEKAKSALSAEWTSLRNYFLTKLHSYQDAGSDYGNFDPDIVDGLAFDLFDTYGPKVWFDFFSLFLPADEPLPCPIGSEAEQATLFAATFSASVGEDLRDHFRDSYGFPIDNSAWPELLGCAQARVNARAFSISEACELDPDALFRNGFEAFQEPLHQK